MSPPILARRWTVRAGMAAVTAVCLSAALQFSAGAVAATPAPAPVNPYSPAYHHPYRHGVVPTIAQLGKMRAWARQHHVRALSSADLNYGGGVDGIGVTTGHQKVYLVFYGSDWGTMGTDGNGNVTLSSDPSGEAPYVQRLLKGLGTGGETWSGVMTQYCQGVAVGTQICPTNNQFHVAYPTGGALAGVWVDESGPSPASATGHQLGVAAVNAAAHFGNTTAAANRNAQYVILSPTGTNPDGWLTNGFCAWHDWNGDTTLSGGAVTSPYGDIAFTNLPYITDQGASCGQDFVNSAGTLDGVSIVEGHEYAETISDQNPPGGYTDSGGAENGDKCAWDQGPGAPAGNLSLTTGTFAMQSTWANDGSGGAGTCEFSHPIVTNGGGGNTVTVSNPGSRTGTVGTATSLQISASDSAGGQTLTYTATGLPAGLSINSATGLIKGTPTTAKTYTVTVTATDTTGAHGSATFSWTINPSGGNIINGGFETGTFFGWTTSGASTSIVSSGQHTGRFAARAGSTSPTNGNSNIIQTFKATHATLTFWYNVTCPDTVFYDWATATLKDNTTGHTSTVLARTCVSRSGWRQVNAALVSGHSYTLTLTSHDDNYPGDPTYTLFDDVSTH